MESSAQREVSPPLKYSSSVQSESVSVRAARVANQKRTHDEERCRLERFVRGGEGLV